MKMSDEIREYQDPLVIRTDNNGTSTLTLNRPKSYNALSQSLMLELQTHLDNIRIDQSIIGCGDKGSWTWFFCRT
jgi:enoyl-CoA hydratase/carnithine racemase